MKVIGLSRFFVVVFVLVGLNAATPGTAGAQSSDTDETEDDTPPVLNVSGSFFSRFELRQHYSQFGGDGSDAVRVRARLGLATQPIAVSDRVNLVLRFVPQVGGFWNVGGNQLVDPSLGLHEGEMVIHSGILRTQVGRFEMTYGDHLVVGNVGWHHTGRAFDGFRLRLSPYDNTDFWIDAFATVLDEGLIDGPVGNPFGSGDQYFTGLYGALGPVFGDGFNFDAYALFRVWPSSRELNADPAVQPTLGVRVKSRAGPIDYRLETGVQIGARRTSTADDAGNVSYANPDVFAYQADVEVGLNFTQGRIGLEGLFASGNDATTNEQGAWDQLFPTAHKWLGYMDAVGGRTNVTGGVLHLMFNPSEQIRLTIDSHTYWRPEVPDGTDNYLGTEIDVGALYRIGRGLRLRAGYGILFSGDDFFVDDPLHFFEFELRYDGGNI